LDAINSSDLFDNINAFGKVLERYFLVESSYSWYLYM